MHAVSNAMIVSIQSDSAGIGAAMTSAAATGPPASTIVPLTVRSSSPNPPSTIENVTVLPLIVIGIAYQCGVGLSGVGPYFQYSSAILGPAGNVKVNDCVEPGMQPLVTKPT